MMEIDDAVEIWEKVDDGAIPPLLNKSAIRRILTNHIQISDKTIDFLDIVFYCILRRIVKECQKRDIKRVSVDDIKSILSDDNHMTFNIGSVIYKTIEMDNLEDIVADKVFKKIVMRTFGSAISDTTKEEFDFESAEFPIEDGEEHG